MKIVSLEDARSKKLKYYFTGIKCSRGHVNERLVINRSCKICFSLNSAKYSKSEKRKAYYREYTKSEKFKQWRSKYLQLEKVKEEYKKYRSTKKYQEIKKKYHISEKYKAVLKKYRQSNKFKQSRAKYIETEKYKDSRKITLNKYNKSEKRKLVINRYDATEKGQINNMWRTLRIRLKNWAGKQNARERSEMERIVGCDKKTLRSYLEAKFKPGMNWKNHGKWHIDHIKPLSKFNPNNLLDIKKANNYTNLQPLWALENLKKGNR